MKLFSEMGHIILAGVLSKTVFKLKKKKKKSLGIHNWFEHFAILIPYYLGSMFAHHILRY